jgi:hypothetical protein
MMRYAEHFRLAQQLGKHLHELMGWSGPMTHRQFVLWCHWLDYEYNLPSRTDYYLMQVACENRRTFSKHPDKIAIQNFRLTIGDSNNQQREATSREQRIEAMKQRWMGRMTAPVTVIRDGKEEKDKYIPPFVRQRQELQRQLEAKKKQRTEQKQKQKQRAAQPTPSSQEVPNGDGSRTGRVAGANERRRQQIRRNAQGRAEQDGNGGK